MSLISHREQVRPFAKMMAKPKNQTKDCNGKRTIEHGQSIVSGLWQQHSQNKIEEGETCWQSGVVGSRVPWIG